MNVIKLRADKIFPFSFFTDNTSKNQQYIIDLSQKIIEYSRSSWRWKVSPLTPLKKELSEISTKQLKEVLEIISKKDEGLEALKILSEILSPKKLEESLGINGTEFAKNLLKEAREYTEQIKGINAPSLTARRSAIFDSIFAALDSVISAFGIAEFFRPAETRSEAQGKAQLVIMLLQFFTLVSTIALPLFSTGKAGLVVGYILFSISLLSLIYPFIRRAPSTLPHAANWTRQYQLGNLQSSSGRKNTILDIAHTLTANGQVKSHALLVGKSGVGKTELIKEFVSAIENGELPELKGKQVFYINTADLFVKDDGLRVIHRISEAMGRHRNNIILVFDEIHLACKKKDGTSIADQLKALLDNKKENLPYVIGITTPEQYDQDIYPNHSAFARRFKQIIINNTTPAQTSQILQSTILKQAPNILLEPHVLKTLLQKTKSTYGKETVEPASSLKLLSLSLKQLAETDKSPLEYKIEELRLQLDGPIFLSSIKQNAQQALQEKLDGLEKQLLLEKEKKAQFHQQLNQLGKNKKLMYRSLVKVAQSEHMASSELNQLILLHQLFLPYKESQLRAKAKELSIPAVLDSKIIEQVIADEKETNLASLRITEKVL